jgi:hypothetical protein
MARFHDNPYSIKEFNDMGNVNDNNNDSSNNNSNNNNGKHNNC